MINGESLVETTMYEKNMSAKMKKRRDSKIRIDPI